MKKKPDEVAREVSQAILPDDAPEQKIRPLSLDEFVTRR